VFPEEDDNFAGLHSAVPRTMSSNIQTRLRTVAIGLLRSVCHTLSKRVLQTPKAERRHGVKHVTKGDMKWNV